MQLLNWLWVEAPERRADVIALGWTVELYDPDTPRDSGYVVAELPSLLA